MKARLSCERLTMSGWRTEPYTLRSGRCYHASWDLSNGSLVLLGGYCSEATTERVDPGTGTAATFQLRGLVRFGDDSAALQR